MIDLHCHLLPAIDDGPPDMRASLEMAREALACGTRTIVATPHVSPSYPNTADDVATSVRQLAERLSHDGIPLRVECGAELDAAHARDFTTDELDRLRLGAGDALLLECPLTVAPIPIESVVHRFGAHGYRILLAHPERSAIIRAKPGLLEDLVANGALTQITTGSLLGQFGRDARRFSLWMLERGLVHNVASDAHDTDRRPPALHNVLTAAASEIPHLSAKVDWLVSDVPEAILAGAPLPPVPSDAPRASRGMMRRLAERLTPRG